MLLADGTYTAHVSTGKFGFAFQEADSMTLGVANIVSMAFQPSLQWLMCRSCTLLAVPPRVIIFLMLLSSHGVLFPVS